MLSCTPGLSTYLPSVPSHLGCSPRGGRARLVLASCLAPRFSPRSCLDLDTASRPPGLAREERRLTLTFPVCRYVQPKGCVNVLQKWAYTDGKLFILFREKCLEGWNLQGLFLFKM